ncbi:MAG: hypothetical protein FJ222_10445, partial [Lentisphaerae bacterium]|nr:hypothetical protein [Lentisphaerota bacterium]
MRKHALTNQELKLEVYGQDGRLRMRLVTVADGLVWSDAPYVYRLTRATENGTITHERVRDLTLKTEDHAVVVRGTLGGLEIKHR